MLSTLISNLKLSPLSFEINNLKLSPVYTTQQHKKYANIPKILKNIENTSDHNVTGRNNIEIRNVAQIFIVFEKFNSIKDISSLMDSQTDSNEHRKTKNQPRLISSYFSRQTF